MVQRPKNGGNFYGHLGSFDTGYRDLFQIDEFGGKKQMTDMNILVVGIVVFGLMFVGLILTVIEFRQISNDNKARGESKTPRHGSEPR